MNTTIIIGILVVIIAAGIGAYYISSQPSTPPTTTTTSSHSITTSTSHPIQTSATSSSTPSTSSTATPTTSTSTASTTSTTAMTTSTSTTTATSTSTTYTTTTSSPTTENITTQKMSFIGLVKHFKHAKIEIEIHNGTTGQTTTNWLSYTRSETSLNGEPTIHIELTYNSSEGSGQIMEVWLSTDYSKILQIKVGGQTLPGQMAEAYGSQMLNAIDTAFFATTSSSLQFKVAEGTAQATMHGWVVEAFNPTQVTISGHTYSGYYYKVTNVNDAESNTAWAEGKIAEIISGQYYHVYMKAGMKNGDTFVIQFAELEA